MPVKFLNYYIHMYILLDYNSPLLQREPTFGADTDDEDDDKDDNLLPMWRS